MAEKKYLKNINVDGVEYGLGLTSDDLYAEIGISKERFVELLSRDAYCPTMDGTPDSTTLTYVDTDGSTNHFQVGQLCKGKDKLGDWQMFVLEAVTEDSATWRQLPTQISVGGMNLLRNSGFTGDYTYEILKSGDALDSSTEVYSRPLKYWEGTASVSDEPAAVSGKSVSVSDLHQQVSLTEGEVYIAGFKAKGTSLTVTCGDSSEEFSLTSGYEPYTMLFRFTGQGIFRLAGTAVVCDLKLERGTIATDWSPSVMDNDKALAEFQKIKYLTDGIKSASEETLGGMALASYIQMGNYKDGVMQQVNAGISGVYTDDNDVAFWGGGALEQAIRTLLLFRENPSYIPSQEEWVNLSRFVIPHGGNGIFRGHVFATGGEIEVSRVASQSFSAAGQQGVTQEINITDTNGQHTLLFTEGLLVGYSFNDN